MITNIFKKVRENIDNLVKENVWWSKPVDKQQLLDAKNGKVNLFFSQNKNVPRDWLPTNLSNISVLCLAGAGGQQAPIMAMTGAKVTVLDLSENMLANDKMIAERENLDIKIEHGNMCDLSRFSDESFDLIINPSSLMYVPSPKVVFKECYRVLKSGGIFIISAPLPVNFLCDYLENEKCYKVVNKIPYKSFEHEDQGSWIEFGHSLEEYLGGLIESGFIISGYYEDKNNSDEMSKYCSTDFVVRAIKL